MAQSDQLIRSLRRFIKFNTYINATVAQSVEQLIRNQQVSGSNPLSSSIKEKTGLNGVFHRDFEKQIKINRNTLFRVNQRSRTWI